MAYEIPGFSFTLVSNADYRTGNGQFRFAKVLSTGKTALAGAGELSVGVRQNTPNANEPTTVVNSGIVFVEAGAAVAGAALVTSDATGRGITATTGNYIHGQALEAASAAGVLFAVLLINGAAKV